MEKFQEFRAKAIKSLNIADHMLFVTYPLIKDSKFFLVILQNIFLAYTNAVSALLYYERLFKRIPPFQESFESKFYMFRQRCVHRHNLDKNIISNIQDIKEILIAHKKSPIEFVRKDRFVICSDNYKVKTLSTEKLKENLNKAKLFIQTINNIIRKDEGIFK